jgi:hypothetical protein
LRKGDYRCALFSRTTAAINDDGLIDAAIGRTKTPSMGLTALQVSGAMPRVFFVQAFAKTL